MDTRIFLYIVIISGGLLFVFGCNVPKEQLTAYNKFYEASDFNSAAVFAQKKIGKGKKPNGDDLLWTLQAAAARRALQDYNSSSQFFDTAEKDLQYYDTRSSAADGVAAVVVNDNIVPYTGQEYDGVMTNIYKALNFMSENKPDLARIEFNRAIDRQRRIKEKFEKEISQARDNINKSPHGGLINQTLSSPDVNKALHDKYPELNEYQAYKDYTNPFVTYVASIYFNSVGESSTARDLLKETYGLVPENKYVEWEFREIDRLFGDKQLKNNVWVIFENGLCPIKEEFRIDLPLFIAIQQVYYAGIALPKLKYRDAAFPYLQIEADGVRFDTAIVSDMDRVIHSEFKKDFDAALIRAIVSTTGKVLAQYAFTQQGSTGGTVGAIMVAAYSFATTAADVRIWTALPKNFQIARFPVPQNRTIKITPLNAQSFDVPLPDCDNTLVYIKIINRNSNPVYNIIPLKFE